MSGAVYEEAGTDLFAEIAYASDTLYPHFPRSVTVSSCVELVDYWTQCPRVRPPRPLRMDGD